MSYPVRTPRGRLLARWLLALAWVSVASLAAAEAPAQKPSTARFEVRFMEDMIDHHAMAVHMAHMCVTKAVHEELRQMCEQMATTQQQEIALMQGWLLDWYGITHQPEMMPGESGHMARLMTLEGARFEEAFMRMMIRHHRDAIVEASQCLMRAEHGALLTLCENIIAVQSAEIRQMRQWLCEWYGRCTRGRDEEL